MVEMKIWRNSNILPLITLTLKITENPNHVEMKMSKTQKFVYMYLSRLVKTSGKCEIKCEGSFKFKSKKKGSLFFFKSQI